MFRDKDFKEMPTNISDARLEKLLLEIKELQAKISWHQRIFSYLPLLTVLVALLGLWYNAAQFADSQERQSKREALSRMDEFRKPFYEKKLNLYIDAITNASIIATSRSEEEREKAEERFNQLYIGSLHLVSDTEFIEAKNHFVRCLLGKAENCKSETGKHEELQKRATALAESARKSIFNTWEIDSEGLPKTNPR